MTKETADEERMLRTTIGDFPLDECRLALAGREWTILHVGAVVSRDEEAEYLRDQKNALPYGVTLWASAIALASEIARRAAEFRGRRVLELGAGTGLPGIVADACGASVRQTDRQTAALALCRRNAALNRAARVEQSLMDWTDWPDAARYDWIIGSDILYAEEMHSPLRRIFAANLAPGGCVLLSDPFRQTSLEFCETLVADGWQVSFGKWSVGVEDDARPVGVFALAPPA